MSKSLRTFELECVKVFATINQELWNLLEELGEGKGCDCPRFHLYSILQASVRAERALSLSLLDEAGSVLAIMGSKKGGWEHV